MIFGLYYNYYNVLALIYIIYTLSYINQIITTVFVTIRFVILK